MKPVRVLQILILLLALLEAFSLVFSVRAQSPEADFHLYLPASVKAGEDVPPPPPGASLPDEIRTKIAADPA